MELKKITFFKKGMVAFAEKQNLMVRIGDVSSDRVCFEVMNGGWTGELERDGKCYHQYGSLPMDWDDLQQVTSVTREEYDQYYMYDEPGTAGLIQREDKLPVAPEGVAGSSDVPPVHEVKVLITVMGQADTLSEITAWVSGMNLADLQMEMDEGELIGQTRVIASETLPDTQVGPRLRDLANDGTFFNMDDDAFDPNARKENAGGRILEAQIAQGWSTETLEMLSRRFIEEMGLSDTYARYLENQARAENDLSKDDDEEPAF